MSDSASGPVTLRAIAQRLGIDHSTVSLALRDSPHISPERRRQVREAADHMGYRPNAFASALGRQRHQRELRPISAELAWLNCWAQPEQLRGYHEFDLYWQGANQAAERAGYRLVEFAFPPGASPKRLRQILDARNITGIIIPPLGRRHPPLLELDDWSRLAGVRLGYSCQNPAFNVVTCDQLNNSLIAFENMWNHGYRRIGFVTSRLVNTRFKAGYLMAQSEHPAGHAIPLLVLESGENPEDDLPHLKQWLRTHRPDAVLTDIAAMRALLSCCGLEVPGDIGLAALSVLDGGSDSGIYQNSALVGEAAVEILLSQLSHDHHGVPETCRETLIVGRWVNGSNLPARRPQCRADASEISTAEDLHPESPLR